ncbi:wdp [Drosophila busckii]|uniref:Wdp n=1 Tax=Drosophila busckii TaxID=30019 RepID=A0A0M4EUK5_DROBS|nr:protein windpipe [Drosophila busckii]XP_017838289.1 protein windpipe [Drosophila busckii]ALC41400.1 wdp [Drosophila busckii]
MSQYKTALLAALLAALLCVYAAATPTPTSAAGEHCPADCQCILSPHTHKPLVHAKCNSTAGLGEQYVATPGALPLHSIDLSFVGLTRLGHALDTLPDVTSLDLSHNELHDFGHLGKRLKKLNLKHNRISSAKLAKLPQHLQVLNLQHNDITYLPMELTHLQQLQQLELGHNEINCSCGTLEVRDWLQEQHVYMEKPVVCSQPLEAHGKPWLQLKKSEICAKEQRGWYDDDENELMMGDQPMSDEPEEHEEELGKDYLIIDGKKAAKSAEPAAPPALSDVEGSGDLTEMNMQLQATNNAPVTVAPPAAEPQAAKLEQQEQEEESEEGSGSGGGMLIIPALLPEHNNHDDFEPPDAVEEHDKKNDDDEFDNKPVEQPAVTFHSQGIFDKEEPVSEEAIVPIVQTKLDTAAGSDVVTDGPLASDKASEDILSAKIGKQDDSNAIYLLLGVIALIVLGLILFVAIKRCRYNSNRAARDAEAARQTELLDMDKKNLGKPLGNGRNGHEHSPLIGEKSKLDDAQIVNGKNPYDNKDNAGGQPLLNGNGTANGDAKDVPTVNEPEPAAHEYYPITPRYPTPQSPRASKYAQHPQNAEQNNNEPDGAYLPSSPKSGRYSPVYSPETGRVKIKLTETPKPKTPMLVNRSKSNAGEIQLTPLVL